MSKTDEYRKLLKNTLPEGYTLRLVVPPNAKHLPRLVISNAWGKVASFSTSRLSHQDVAAQVDSWLEEYHAKHLAKSSAAEAQRNWTNDWNEKAAFLVQELAPFTPRNSIFTKDTIHFDIGPIRVTARVERDLKSWSLYFDQTVSTGDLRKLFNAAETDDAPLSLLEALDELQAEFDGLLKSIGHDETPSCLIRARAALKKARGE